MIYPVPKPKKKRRVRHTPQLTRSPMRKNGPRTKRTGGNLFPDGVDEARREFIRSLPCILTDRCCYAKGGIPLAHICVGPRQACHVKSRGSGGVDKANMYPGCSAAHDQQGIIGIPAFNKMWGLDLKFMAEEYEQIYVETRLGGVPHTGAQP
jgi:hypothetical protein